MSIEVMLLMLLSVLIIVYIVVVNKTEKELEQRISNLERVVGLMKNKEMKRKSYYY